MDNSEKTLKDLKWELHQAEEDLINVESPRQCDEDGETNDDWYQLQGELNEWKESQELLIQSLKDEINKRWDSINRDITLSGAQHILDNPEEYGLV